MPVEIIAEIGVNHNGSSAAALALFEMARTCGADTVKIQTFDSEALVTPGTSNVAYQRRNTAGNDHGAMLRTLELSLGAVEDLRLFAESIGLSFLSTPYTVQDALRLMDLGLKRFKTSSADLVDHQLHEFIAENSIESLVSVGMATDAEIARTQDIYESSHCRLLLLHCVSQYPTPAALSNIRRVKVLRDRFGVATGFSDHTLTNEAAILAVGLGASVIEKHLTLDKTSFGPDHATSLSPQEFADFVRAIRRAESCLTLPGEATLTPEEAEMKTISRKVLRARREIEKGEVIKQDDLQLMRPGIGLTWENRSLVVGKCANRKISKFEAITAADIA